MLNAAFLKVINNVPHIVAIFSVVEVPDWASEILEIGDEVYWCSAKDTMRTVGKFGQPHGHKNLNIRAGNLKFERFGAV